jgi:hypothetical protein
MLFEKLVSLFELKSLRSVDNVAEVREPGRANPGYWNLGGWMAAGGEFQSDDIRGLNDGDADWLTVCEGGEFCELKLYDDGIADAYGEGEEALGGCDNTCATGAITLGEGVNTGAGATGIGGGESGVLGEVLPGGALSI